MTRPSGPLVGVRVLEIGGIGPNPFAGMLLADMGADVLRLDRPTRTTIVDPAADVTLRGRATVNVDLKDDAGRELALSLCERADALIEGFRPGVMERLGLGPEQAHARNPRLVYGRVTGYGQSGPLSSVAGHDVNYLSLTGVLRAFARRGERPVFPLNLLGDYGGGAMFLAFGVVCGLLEARTSGVGQVIDAAIVDGVASLGALVLGMRAAGEWTDDAGDNLLDSGAHFYNVYETADRQYVAVGAIEPQFYERLLALLEIPGEQAPQWERARWPALTRRFAEVFRSRPRAAWAALEGEDACLTPVLGFGEAAAHPHNAFRRTFTEIDGVIQPAVTPRFSRTPGSARPALIDSDAVLARWGRT